MGKLDPPDVLGETLAAEWRVGMAAELLLLDPQLRKGLEHGLTDEMQLFGDEGLCWGQIKDCPVSAALFPVAGEEGLSPLRIWAFQGAGELESNVAVLDGHEMLQRQADQNGVVLYLENPDNLKIIGRSWQLAAALALKCLGQNVTPSTRLELAGRRIVTGVLDEGSENITSVLIGNKLLGLDLGEQRRTWMVPDCDKTAFEEAAKACTEEVPALFFSNLVAAYRDVAGYGARPAAEQNWPGEIEEMHALVGGTITTILAPLLYCRPQKLYLWHSDNEKSSREPAERVRSLIFEHLPAMKGCVHVGEMPSNSVAHAEEVLRQALTSVAASRIWFNVTGGNRLMMLAVDCLARADGRIQLIYRDRDEQTLAYVHNWHEAGHFHTGLLMPRVGGELAGAVSQLLNCGFADHESCFAGAVAIQRKPDQPDLGVGYMAETRTTFEQTWSRSWRSL